ncbi:MAG TPA: isoprenylcysteine carboxylmethyltransferase family protein [Streptosporangiaceae bacterium]|nr:isoprenylcysteine carboxylmethyltransferase family protein [Streptosporangiaceae bacterium]
MRAGLTTPYLVSICCWVALEVGLAARDVARRKARRGSDRGTRGIVALSLGGSIFVGNMLRQWVPSLDMPVPNAFAIAGLVVIWAGLAVRVWAVLTLGGSFSTFVHAEAGQAVVTGGPYRWVRHPSYTGLLLIALGFGLGARNWLSLLVCAIVPVLGLLPRIAVEESELSRVLGEPYRSYQRTTRSLMPGLW